jgi:ferrous iron transport protein A
MKITLIDLKAGERALIIAYDKEVIPLKLIEMGCIEGNEVSIVKITTLNDPIYLNINNTFLAIRRHMAAQIEIQKL